MSQHMVPGAKPFGPGPGRALPLGNQAILGSTLGKGIIGLPKGQYFWEGAGKSGRPSLRRSTITFNGANEAQDFLEIARSDPFPGVPRFSQT